MNNSFSGYDPGGAAQYFLNKTGADTRIAPHFSLGEFACRDGSDIVLVHPALLVMLERIREKWGSPITITSGYRTPEYNRRIGGAEASVHLLGMAADIVVKGVAPLAVYAYVSGELQAGGVGLYPTFTHVDVWGEHRRWKG